MIALLAACAGESEAPEGATIACAIGPGSELQEVCTLEAIGGDEDGIRRFTGVAGFPIPQNGAEGLWNSRTNGPNHTLTGIYKDIAVFSNGSRSTRNSLVQSEYPYSNPENKVGATEEELAEEPDAEDPE